MTSHRCGPSHASAESAGVGYHRAKGLEAHARECSVQRRLLPRANWVQYDAGRDFQGEAKRALKILYMYMYILLLSTLDRAPLVLLRKINIFVQNAYFAPTKQLDQNPVFCCCGF